jgi:hypothetical protein
MFRSLSARFLTWLLRRWQEKPTEHYPEKGNSGEEFS